MSSLYKIVTLVVMLCIVGYLCKYSNTELFTEMTSTVTKDWLEELFEKRQIITIPSRVQNVSEFCESLEIKETIFNAILKKDLSYNNIYNLKMGEIACAMSQENVLQKFVDSGEKTLLMFEDDIMPINHEVYVNSGITLDHIKKYIQKCMNYLPNGWDVIYFGRCWDNCAKHIKINKYLVKIHRAMCHHAIGFSREGAKKILENISHPMSKPIDHVVSGLCSIGAIDCYASIVPVFYQNRDELSTTIGNFDKLPVCA